MAVFASGQFENEKIQYSAAGKTLLNFLIKLVIFYQEVSKYIHSASTFAIFIKRLISYGMGKNKDCTQKLATLP